jgi:uncharacterized protein (DUF58 family)
VANAGVYTSLPELVGLQFAARGFSLLGKQPSGSPLIGRCGTRLRGRGLSFEELRGYRPGDDVRSIDWKVTARTQKPHIRVYTEERERPVLLVVDQRLAMFFGTQCQMKSVTAAELAAIVAWQVVDAGDRVGVVAFNDSEVLEVDPHRNRRTLMRVLETLVKQNTALGVDEGIAHNPAQLNHVLEGVARRAAHDWIVVIISDFQGIADDTRAIIKRIARHNDVIAALVFDAAAVAIPSRRQFVVSDTHMQVQIDTGDAATRRGIAAIQSQRLERLDQIRSELTVPILPIDTSGEVARQLLQALGFRQRTA